MKTFTTLLLLFTASLYAQNSNMDVILMQDVRLAYEGHNDKSDSFKTNVRLVNRWNAKDTKLGNFFLAPEVEYADLEIQYIRYAGSIGFRFNTFTDRLKVSLSGGVGLINREGASYSSYSGDIIIQYYVTKGIALTLSNQTLQRQDVKSKDFVNSNFFGLTFKLF